MYFLKNKNFLVKSALFAVCVALVFSFISCAVNMAPQTPVESEKWSQISISNHWGRRERFQAVTLNNGHILVMGGAVSSTDLSDSSISRVNDIWLSKDNGRNWSQIPAANHWSPRYDFQAVVLGNGDVLVMGGDVGGNVDSGLSADIYLSKDGGSNWSLIASNPWRHRQTFQAVVLNNNDILVMGGNVAGLGNFGFSGLGADIYLSKDGGSNWSQIPASNHWSPREGFQAVVLGNGDVLVMGGEGVGSYDYNSAVYLSKDSGTNWSLITTNGFSPRSDFQTMVLDNNDILLLGGLYDEIEANGFFYNINHYSSVTMSSDGGTNWNEMLDQDGGLYYPARYAFQAVVLENNDVLVLGGRACVLHNQRRTVCRLGSTNDIWLRQF